MAAGKGKSDWTRQSGVPPALGKTRLLFDRADIDTLAKHTGLGLLAGADRAILAYALSQAFLDAAFFQQEKHERSNGDLAKNLTSISAAAHDLLERLGFDCRSDALLSDTEPRSYWSQRAMAEGYQLIQRIAPLTADCSSLRRAIAQAPEAIAAIQLIANMGRAAIVNSGPAKAGKRPEKGRDYLFCRLAGLFYASFGYPPAVTNRAAQDQDSCRWIRAVLTIARWRLKERVALNYEGPDRDDLILRTPLASLTLSAAALSIPTKADRLMEGWSAWTALTEEQKWPMHIWQPFGYTPGASLVPKWVAKRGSLHTST